MALGNMKYEGGRKVILRCIIYKRNSKYTAVNLELGLAATGDSLQEVKERMQEAIKAYINTVSDCINRGENVHWCRPVPFYWPKRVLFESARLAREFWIRYCKWAQKATARRCLDVLRTPLRTFTVEYILP